MKDLSSEDQAIFREIHESLSTTLPGDVSPEGMARLQGLLAGNPRAQQIYLMYIAETSALRNWGSSQLHGNALIGLEPDPATVLELIEESERIEQQHAIEEARQQAAEQAALELEQAELRRRSVQHIETNRLPYTAIGLMAAASVLFLLMFTGSLAPPNQSETVSPAESSLQPEVVTVSDAIGADLSVVIASEDAPSKTESATITTGTRLAAGHYVLTNGLLQLVFDSGAQAILAAPSEFELLGSNKALLINGKLVGKVPPQAIGFTVETPTSTIVDLGTEFGVEFSPAQQAMEVHVFGGEVSMNYGFKQGENGTGKSLGLIAGQAALVDNQNKAFLKETEVDRFVRFMPTTIDYVGIHEGVGAELRTAATQKPLDADGNHVLGSAGYYFFNAGHSEARPTYAVPLQGMLVKKPSFVEDRPGFNEGVAAGEGVYSVGGLPGYLNISDPRLSPGQGTSVIKSGVLSYPLTQLQGRPLNPQRARRGSEVEMCSLALGVETPATGFRLGVFTDNGELPETVPQSIRVSINDVEAEVKMESKDLDGDVYFFDINRAQKGDVVKIHARLADKFVSVGGLTFDVPNKEEL
ncbi:FecR family protein [Adhaeretor mobilis]|uniref:FecR protein n=1 Tax=Adhaeretor mobilis TaxID=1930276 RepID=A0A517MU78_9BACT|nr:FecR domain-containing protein [Adhaeretor mobilis]QDS98422.1 FecR protein [Adhaeretor mobilis]